MLSSLSSLLSDANTLEPLSIQSVKEELKEGENRFASILFADLRGFSTISEVLSPDTIQSLLDQLMLSFSERVQKYGGYVDKYEGDRIMAHFGSIAFLEQNSRRAVYAGLEIIAVVQKFNQIKSNIPELSSMQNDLSIRVGINSGTVATGKVGIKRDGDFTVYGEAVNLASRMEENGVLLKVMIPEQVKNELDSYFNFEYHGKIRVKGFSKPITTWLVDSVSHKYVSRKLSSGIIVGREDELALLKSVYENNARYLETGNCEQALDVISVTAEAGMGKTRLIYEYCSQLPANSYFVAEISPLYQVPYISMMSLVNNMTGGLSGNSDTARQQLLSLVSEHIPDQFDRNSMLNSILFMAGLFSLASLTSQQREEFIGELNYYFLAFIQSVAVKCASNKMVLNLIFDDLHFTDEASLKGISYLIKNLNNHAISQCQSPIRIMIILAWRDSFEPGNLISGKCNLHKIALKMLSVEHLQRFVTNSIPNITITKTVIDKLIQNSMGNPLYLEEWISTLESAKKPIELLDSEHLLIPNNISTLILSRLNSFDKKSLRLLQDLSVIGMSFERVMINRLELELGVLDDPGASLQQAIHVRYIENRHSTSGKSDYGFRHQLIQETIYKTILDSNKRILHKHVANIIENLYQEHITQWSFALGEHYYNANISDKAVYYLTKSEVLARSLYMYSKALECSERLITLSDEVALPCKLLHKSLILLDMGNYRKAKITLESIHYDDLTDECDRDDFILASARMLMAEENPVLVREYLEQNISKITTRIAKNKAAIYLMDVRRLALCEQDFIQDAERLLTEFKEDKEACARMENIIGLWYQNRGEHKSALEHFDRAISFSAELKNILRWVYQNKASVLRKTGHFQDAQDLYNKALNICRIIDDEAGMAKLYADLGTLYRDMDNLEKALDHFQESKVLAFITANPRLQSLAAYNIAVCRFDQGDFKQARKFIKESMMVSQKLADNTGLSMANDLLGDILYQEGKLLQAKKLYLKNMSLQNKIQDHEGLAHTFGNLGNVAALQKDYPLAESYYLKQQIALHDIGDIEGEGKSWFNWAIMNEEQGCIEEAIIKVKTAYELFSEGGFVMYLDTVKTYLDDLTRRESIDDER